MSRWLTQPPVLYWRTAAAVIIAVMLTACGGDSGDRQRITVFAASSLTEAFTELADAFEEEFPEYSVMLNFDGSQRLRFQLEHGARADVFASADQRQMELAQDAGLLAGDAIELRRQPAGGCRAQAGNNLREWPIGAVRCRSVQRRESSWP